MPLLTLIWLPVVFDLNIVNMSELFPTQQNVKTKEFPYVYVL